VTLPGDVAVVIRGGIGRDAESLHEGLQSMIAKGIPARVSVFALPYDPSRPFDEAVVNVCRAAHAPWGQVQVSTVERLRSAGFELADERAQDEEDCHFHVSFRPTVELWEAEAFIQSFDQPIPNPVSKDERRRK
jgi:hypothetical protein